MTNAADPSSEGDAAWTSEASFEDLYHLAACGQLSTDDSDSIISVNDTFLEWTGYRRDQIVGRTFRELLTPGSRIFHETRYQPVLRLKGEVREVAFSLICSDETVLPILVNSRAWNDKTGHIRLVRMAIFDSTERQDYEHQLLAARKAAEMSEQRVRILQGASSAYAATLTEASLASALVASGRDAFAAADGAVVLSDDAGSFRVSAGAHLLGPLIELRAAQSARFATDGPMVMTLANLADATAVSPQAAEALRSIRMEAVSAVPLIGERGPLGSLVLFYGRAREFDEPTIELHQALARQAALVLDRIHLQAELHELAMHDQLTGLANRNLLRERLSHTLALAERSRRPMSLIFLDLDGFKIVNDDLGHRVGDAVLQTIARRINGVVREADIVGRFGGDEFLIICEGADENAAILVAERVIETVAEPLIDLKVHSRITASVGIASYLPGPGTPPTNDSIVRAADAAMYRSKNSGAGRITLTKV